MACRGCTVIKQTPHMSRLHFSLAFVSFVCLFPSQVAECNRLNERLASSQQQLADLQSLREVDTLDIESRQVLLLTA